MLLTAPSFPVPPRGGLRDPRLVPWTVGPVVAVLSTVEAWLDPTFRPHAWAAVTGGVLLAVAFMVAGRLPLLGALLAAVTFPLGQVLGVPGPGGAGLIGLLTVVGWVAYAVPGRRAVPALAAVGASVAVSAVLEARSWWEAVFFAVALLPVVLVGRLVARGQRRERRLAELAAALDAEREAAARTAVMEERTRLAREVHDAVAHAVSVMVLQVGGVRRQLDDVLRDRPDERDVLLGVERVGRQAVTEMRGLVGILRGGAAADLPPVRPSLDRLDELLADVRAAGVTVDLRRRGDMAPLPAGLDASAYRVLQEALTNVIRHAGPVPVRVVVDRGPDALVLTVEDVGGRPAEPAVPGGHGLAGMRERVALFDGSLEAGPVDGGGFRVVARFPRRRWT